jgi:AraC family transcriptional activator of pyochelin receptor
MPNTKLTLESEDFEGFTRIIDYTNKLNEKEKIKTYQFDSNYNGISYQGNTTYFDGLFISYSKGKLEKDSCIQVKKETSHLELHIEFLGGTQYVSNSKKTQIDIPPNTASLFYLNDLDGKLIYPKTENKEMLEIEFSNDFFLRFQGSDNYELEKMIDAIQLNKDIQLFGKSFNIGVFHKHILNDIIACKYEGIMKKIFLESKVLELMTNVISYNNIPKDEKIKLAHADIEKLFFVRSLLIEDFSNPKTIKELASLSGLNEFKLKLGFKQLFNDTIFNFMNHARLEHSKSLLQNTELSVYEISTKIGYKNPQHFSSAFKLKFGYSPNQLRK